MTEDEARAWVKERFDGAAIARLEALAALVIDESERQNLIGPSTLGTLWSRHIVDSLQLLPLATDPDGAWIDIGTGAGFPGLAVAAAQPSRDMTLVEPRRLRAEYLRRGAALLGLDRVTVIQDKVERVARPAAILSARAVANIDRLFASAIQCADKNTVWLLPKGKSAREEVAQARGKWHGMFHVEHSLTDPESRIVVATGVRPR